MIPLAPWALPPPFHIGEVTDKHIGCGSRKRGEQLLQPEQDGIILGGLGQQTVHPLHYAARHAV